MKKELLNKMKIYIDPGYSVVDSGTVINRVYFRNLPILIGQLISDYLTKNYQGVSVKLSRTKDEKITSKRRITEANMWGADLYLSIYMNVGEEAGFESYILAGDFLNKSHTEHVRKEIHDTIITEMSWKDRGKKQTELDTLKATKMSAVKTRYIYLDQQMDRKRLQDLNWLRNLATSYAKGVANALDLKQTQLPLYDDPFYRVVVGSFLEESKARKKVLILKSKGYESYILPYPYQNERYYRVIAGAYRQVENAQHRVKELRIDGFESFIVEL